MGIRPADMQMVVQKTQDVHQAKQNVVSKQDNELLNAQVENKEETQKKSQMVNTLEQKEQEKIKNDKKREDEKNKKQKKRKKKEEELREAEQKEVNLFEKAGTKFDMKV